MSDSILNIFKKRTSEKTEEEEARSRVIANERERKCHELISGVDEQLDRMFERLEALEYSDPNRPASIREVPNASGEMEERVTWLVGRSTLRRYVQDETVQDIFYVCSDRSFARSVGDSPWSAENLPVRVLDLHELSLEELVPLVESLDRIGAV
jgi:hypothetical protein